MAGKQGKRGQIVQKEGIFQVFIFHDQLNDFPFFLNLISSPHSPLGGGAIGQNIYPWCSNSSFLFFSEIDLENFVILGKKGKNRKK